MKASHTSDGLKGTTAYCKIGIEMPKKYEPKHSSMCIPSPPVQPITFQTPLQCHCSSAQKPISRYKEANVHTTLTKELWSRSVVLYQALRSQHKCRNR